MRSAQLDEAGVDRARGAQTSCDDALISPVLTAHPTEVQRKSILDAEHDIARLLAERDRPLTPQGTRATTKRCCAPASRTLWQTRMLRYRQADRRRRDRERAVLLPHHLPARDCRRCTTNRGRDRAQSRRRHARLDDAPSCRWAAGSAATATAIRTSTPTRMQHALARQADHASSTSTSTKCTRWAPSCRSRRCWSASAPRLQALADALARPVAAPQRRAVPPRADRHLRAAGRDRARRSARHRMSCASEVGAADALRRRREFRADLQVHRSTR